MNNKNQNKAIFFIHKGNQPYVRTVIESTRDLNPDEVIIFLGNEANEKIRGVRQEYIDNYYTYGQKVQNIYKHLSPNSPEFELFCITRWFVILEYMEKHGIEIGCHYDSDVVNFVPTDFSMCEEKMCICYDGGHICIFKREQLHDLCDSIITFYEKKVNQLDSIYSFRKANGLWGGVHDLTFIWDYKIRNTDIVRDLSIVNSLTYYDHNINSESDGFEMLDGKKKIYYYDNKYYVRDVYTLEYVEIKLLHLSGVAKKYILALSNKPCGNDNLFFDYYSEAWIVATNSTVMKKEMKSRKLIINLKERMFQVSKKIVQIKSMK